MNFDYLLAELRSAAEEFKQNPADKCLSTALFCQRACKAIDKVKAEADTFENQVIGLWVIVGYINDLIVQLADGDSLTELSNKLFQQCARTVLDIQWQQLDEDTPSRQNFQASLASCHDQMMPRGYTRFGQLQSLMDQPWTEPTLSLVMGSEDDNEEGEGLAYIKTQDPEILRLRVELMLQENCDEFALNLCTWCLKHPVLERDLSLRRTQVTLLHRLGNEDRLQEECQKIGVEDSIKLITSLQEKEDAHELCTVLAQTVLVQNWIKPSNHQSKQKLLHLWIRQQHQVDPDHDKFVSSLWAVAKLSPSTEQLLHVIDAVKEQCGDEFIQFYTDLCVFAINVDKVYWEKLVKEGAASGEEAAARKRDMAKVCQKLAVIIANASPKIAFCCALTAFALHPSEELLQAVCDGHANKSRASLLDLQKGKETKEDEVNIATIYEVERLCGMLRPAYLSPDNDFPNLFAMCKQYLRKESGEASKLGLPALMRSQKGTKTSPPVSSDAFEQARNSLSTAGKPIQETSGLPGNMGSAQSITANPIQDSPVHLAAEVAKMQTRKIVSAQQQQQVLPPKPLLATLVRPQTAGQTPLQVANRPVTSLEVSLVQQMVLKQLSTDVIQTLLQLVQSGHVSPQQLSQVLSHPGITTEALQNLVLRASSQKPTAGQKTPPRQQPQTQVHQKPLHQQAQLQQLQQQQLRQQLQQHQLQLQKQQQQQLQQQQNIQQQLQQQKLQKQLQELQLAKSKEQATVGQVPGLPLQQKVVVQQPQNMPKTVKIEPRQAQQTSCLATAAPLQNRIVADQMVMQPLPSAQRVELAPRQPRVQTVQLQQQQFLTGVQQVRPTLASNISISTLRLTSDGQFQSLQLLAFPQPGVAQAQGESPKSAAQLVLHSTSHVLTHMSGGTITAIAKSDAVEPRMAVHLQPSVSAVKSSTVTSAPVPGSPLAPQMKGLATAGQHLVTVSATSAAQSAATHSADGNRHYLINNLLFTGESQNSTLSIALPDTLPEISVDSVSDTLRALGDPSASNQGRASMVSTQQTALGATGLSQVKQQPQSQVLPSIATLFAPNRQPTPLPSPVALNNEETTVNVAVPGSSSAGSLLKVQKKTGNEKSPGRGTKKEGEVKATPWSKEDLTKLLRQAMTLNMDKKQESSTNTGSSYLHLPEHPVMTPSQTKTLPTTVPAVHPQPQLAMQPQLHLHVSQQPTMQNQTQELLRQQIRQSAPPGPNVREGGFLEHQGSAVPQPLKYSSIQPSVASPSSSLHLQTLSPNIIPAGRLQTSAVLPSPGCKVPQPSAAASLSQIREAHPMLGCVPAAVQSMLSNSQADHIPVSGLVATSCTILPLPKIEQQTAEQPVPCPAGKNVPTYPGYSSALNPGNVFCTLSGAEPVQNSVSAGSIPIINEKTVDAPKAEVASSNTVPAAASMPSSPKVSLEQDPMALSGHPQQQISQPLTGAMACEAAVAPQPAAGSTSSSALENGGILVDNRSGESIATYRCIICSMPFMTLDDLRIHVRQICKPGAHPPSLGDRMALNKAQALEAGLETSTVFQCMRCFELCISESGIREHKLVCSKAPKPKPKSRPRPKPKSPKILSEEEQATEAKVLELLNKCLGENREKLLNSEASSPKKKPVGEQESTEDVEAKKKKKPTKKKSPVPAEENSEEQAENGDGAQTPDVKPKPKRPKKKPEQSEGRVDSAALADAGEKLLEKEVADSSLTQTGEPKPKPKRKYYPKKPKTAEAGAAPAGEQTKGTDKGSIDDGKEGERTVKKNSRKPKPSVPPPPRYKELSGSGGRSFYKCVICGQTLCSLVNFAEHWTECIAKNPPPPPKPRRVSKDRKVLQTKALRDGAGQAEQETKIATLSSELQLQEDSDNPAKQELCRADENVITQGDNLKPALPAEDLFQTNTETTPVHLNDSLAEEAKSFQEGFLQSFGESPLIVAADDIEVVNELNVETTTEIQESYPQVRDPVVLLEKVDLPDRVQCIKIKERFSCNETEGFDSMAENSNDTLEFPLSSKQCVDGQLKVPVRKKLGKFSGQKSHRLKGGRSWLKRDSVHAKLSRTSISVKSIRKAAVHLPKTSTSSESYCSLCQKNFHKKQILIQHFASRHLHPYTVKKLGDTSSYFCHMCQRVFSQFSLYLGHLHHHSQAILKKIQDMSSNDVAGRSRRIACQRGVPGQAPSRHGRTSPRDLTVVETWGSDSGSRDTHRSASESFSSDGSNPPPEAASVRSLSGKPDRRRSGRDAQKQALSKIYIGTLGIYNQGEAFQEYGKKRLSVDATECDDNPDSKILKKRKLEAAENLHDEVSSEETFGSCDKEEARVLMVDADSNVAEDSCIEIADDQKARSLAGENASAVIKNENQGSTPISGLPNASATPPAFSPTSGVGKKPTFLDSYMSYISKRSPEEPLLLNRCRKRYASAGNRQEEQTTASSIGHRRSSCEAQQSSNLSQIVSPRTTSSRALFSPVQLKRSSAPSSNNTGTGVFPKHPWEGIDLSRVYYIGNLEQQLIQKCSVNLGTRVLPSEIERLTKQGQTMFSGSISQAQADKELKGTEWEALISKPVIMLEKLETLQEKAGALVKNATKGPAENDVLKTGSEVEPQSFSDSCDPRDSHEHTEMPEDVDLELVTDASSELLTTSSMTLRGTARDLSSETDVSDSLPCPVTVAQLAEEIAPSTSSQTNMVRPVPSLGCESEIREQQLDLPMEQVPVQSGTYPSQTAAGCVESVLCSDPYAKKEVSVLGTFESVLLTDEGKEKGAAENSKSLSSEPTTEDKMKNSQTLFAEKVEEGTCVDRSVPSDYNQGVSADEEAERGLNINKEVGEPCSTEAISPTVESNIISNGTEVDTPDVYAPNDVSGPLSRYLVDQSRNEEPHIHKDAVQPEVMDPDAEKAFDGHYWDAAMVPETTGGFLSQVVQVQPATAMYPSVQTASDCVNILAGVASGFPRINKEDSKTMADQQQTTEKLVLQAKANQASGAPEQKEAASSQQAVFHENTAEDQSAVGNSEEQQGEPEGMRTLSVVNSAELSLVVYSSLDEECASNSHCSAVQESIGIFHEHKECSGSNVITTHNPETPGVDESEISDSLENDEDVVKIIDLSEELLSMENIQNISEAASNSGSALIETDPMSLSQLLHCHSGGEKTESSDVSLRCTDMTVEHLNRDKNVYDKLVSPSILTVEEKPEIAVQLCCTSHLEAEEVPRLEAVKDRDRGKRDVPERPAYNRDTAASSSVEWDDLADCSEQGISVTSEVISSYVPDHAEEDACRKQDVERDVCNEQDMMPSVLKEDLVQNSTTEDLNTNSLPALGNLLQKSEHLTEGERQPSDLVESAVSLSSTERFDEKELPMTMKSQRAEVDDSVACAFVLAEMGNTISLGPTPSELPELQTSASIDKAEHMVVIGTSSEENATDLGSKKSDIGEKILEGLVQKEITESRTEIPAEDRRIKNSEDIAEMNQICLIQQITESRRQLDSLPAEQFVPEDYREESDSGETNAVGNIADSEQDLLSSENKMTETLEDQEEGSRVISALSSAIFHLHEQLAERDETCEADELEGSRSSTTGSLAGIKIKEEHSECRTVETSDADKAGDSLIEGSGELGQMVSIVCCKSEIVSFLPTEHWEEVQKRENLAFTEVASQQKISDASTTISTPNIESTISTGPSLFAKKLPESFREVKDLYSLNMSTNGIVSEEMTASSSEETIDGATTSQVYSTSLLAEPEPEFYGKTSGELSAFPLNITALDESMSKSHEDFGCLIKGVSKTDEAKSVHSEGTESRPSHCIKCGLSKSGDVILGSCEEAISLAEEPGGHLCGDAQKCFDQSHHGAVLEKSKSEISDDSNVSPSGLALEPEGAFPERIQTESNAMLNAAGLIGNVGEKDAAVSDVQLCSRPKDSQKQAQASSITFTSIQEVREELSHNDVSHFMESRTPGCSTLVHESMLMSVDSATTAFTSVLLAVDGLSTSINDKNAPLPAQNLSDVVPSEAECNSGEETKIGQDVSEPCEGVKTPTSTDLDFPKEKVSDDEDRLLSMDTKFSSSTYDSSEVAGEVFMNQSSWMKEKTLCCSSLEDPATACQSCRLRSELAGKRDCGSQGELIDDSGSTGLSLGDSNASPSGLPLEPEGAFPGRIQTESDTVLNATGHIGNVGEKDATVSDVQLSSRPKDSQKQAQSSSMTFTSIQEVREELSHTAAEPGRVLRSASAGNLVKEAAKPVLDDKSGKKHSRLSAAAADVIDEVNKQMAQYKSGPSRASAEHASPSPESSPKHMTRNQAAAKGKRQAEDSLDQDPDWQLPELCVVTEPRQRKLNLRPDFLKTSSIALRAAANKNKLAVANKTHVLPSEDPNTVVSAVVNSHEVKIVMLKGGGKKQGSDCSPPQTYTVAKMHKVEPESHCAVETEASRKPLKGVKSLRQLIQPKPFVWEMDDVEDSSKQARNERSRRAFRKQVSMAPFTWDMDEVDQDGSHGDAKVISTVQGKTTPDGSEDRAERKIMPSKCVAERDIPVSKSQAVKHSLGCSSQPVFSKGEDTQPVSSVEENLSRNSASRKMGGTSSFSEQMLSREYSTDSKEENLTVSDQSASSKRRAVLKQKVGNCTSSATAEIEGSLRSRSVVSAMKRISVEPRSDSSCRDGMQEPVLSKDLGKTKEVEETPGHLNTRSLRKRKISGTPETRFSSLPPKRVSEGEGKQKTKLADLTEGNSRVPSQDPFSDVSMALRSKDRSPSVDSPTRAQSNIGMDGGAVSDSSTQEKGASCATDMGSINRVINTRGADIRSVIKSLRSKEVLTDVHLCSSTRPVLSASSSSDADSVKGRLICSTENSPDRDSPSRFRFLRSKESSPVLDSHGSNLLNKDKSVHAGTAVNVRSLRLKKSCSSDLDTNIGKTEGVEEKLARSGTELPLSTEGRMSVSTKDLKVPSTAGITSAISALEPSGNTSRIHRTRQSSGDTSLKTHLKDSSPSTVSEGLARLARTKESIPFDNRGRPRHQNTNASPAKSLRSGLTRSLAENASSAPSHQRKDKVEQATAELRKDQVDMAQLQAEVHSRRVTASAHVPHATVQVRSPRRSLPVSAEPLRAMVRRRPKTSLSTAVPVKKSRILHSQVQHQVEVIRVEPVVPPQNNARRTRSHDRDPSPHTVHTRISAEEYQASSSKKTVVKATDQKWLMNRCIAPSARKGVPEQRFPFAFKLARSRTQTK